MASTSLGVLLSSSFDGKIPQNLFTEEIGDVMGGFTERYEIEVHMVGFNKNHMHALCRFLPKYLVGHVVRLMKSITAWKVFRRIPIVK